MKNVSFLMLDSWLSLKIAQATYGSAFLGPAKQADHNRLTAHGPGDRVIS